jgi:hypothetical protein
MRTPIYILNLRHNPNLARVSAFVVVLLAAITTTAAVSSLDEPAAAARSEAAISPTDRHDRTIADQMTAADRIERGRYIVSAVARCNDCHTPRDQRGNPNEARLLMGAPVPYLPARPTQDWPTMCPRIGGTPPGTDQQMITLLTTGVWKDGGHLRAPMPQFRMTREDAEAVLAFLKSLPAY